MISFICWFSCEGAHHFQRNVLLCVYDAVKSHACWTQNILDHSNTHSAKWLQNTCALIMKSIRPPGKSWASFLFIFHLMQLQTLKQTDEWNCWVVLLCTFQRFNIKQWIFQFVCVFFLLLLIPNAIFILTHWEKCNHSWQYGKFFQTNLKLHAKLNGSNRWVRARFLFQCLDLRVFFFMIVVCCGCLLQVLTLKSRYSKINWWLSTFQSEWSTSINW